MTQSYLIGALEKFDQIRIFDEDADLANRSQYFLETAVLNDPADRIQLRLVAADSREVVWSGRIKMAAPLREADLDKAVIEIAGSYGKISQHELSKYRGDYTPGYPCLLQFHQYMRFRDPANLEPVLRCMDASAQQFPNDSYLEWRIRSMAPARILRCGRPNWTAIARRRHSRWRRAHFMKGIVAEVPPGENGLSVSTRSTPG